MRTCKHCLISKPLTDFHKCGKGARLFVCKTCRSILRKSHTALYHLKHANKIKIKTRANLKKYNKNRAEAKRLWVQANFAQVSARNKAYKKANKDTINAHNRMRAAKKRGSYYEKILKKTLKQIKESFNNKCAYCGRSGKLVWDHVYPISKGGPHTVENLLPACEPCNLRKHAKLPLQWFAENHWIIL